MIGNFYCLIYTLLSRYMNYLNYPYHRQSFPDMIISSTVKFIHNLNCICSCPANMLNDHSRMLLTRQQEGSNWWRNCFGNCSDQFILNWPRTAWHLAYQAKGVSAILHCEFGFGDRGNTADFNSCTHKVIGNRQICKT